MSQEPETPLEEHSPVVIFVYKRPEYTLQLFESLLKCPEFSRSKIYVFSDGAKNKEESEQVGKVREIVAKYTNNLDCRVVLRPTNLGLAESVIVGVSEVMRTHPSAIVVEDDLVVSQDFLRYMNWGLSTFRDDPRIFSMTAFSFPIDYFSLPTSYHHSVYLSPRCNSWSWATWRDRWAKVDWEISDFDEFMNDINQRKGFRTIGWDLPRMLRFQQSGGIDSWAIRFCYAHFKSSAYCVHPRSTLVRNTGLNRSGTHSWRDRRFEHHSPFSPWREGEYDYLVEPNAEISDEIYRLFAGKNGPLQSRLRGVLSRSVVGRLLQNILAFRRSRARR